MVMYYSSRTNKVFTNKEIAEKVDNKAVVLKATTDEEEKDTKLAVELMNLEKLRDSYLRELDRIRAKYEDDFNNKLKEIKQFM